MKEELLKNAGNCFEAPSGAGRFSNAINKRELIACACPRGVCSNSKLFTRKGFD